MSHAISYIFFSWIWTDYVYAFISTVIFAAFDFYTVKNITGRFYFLKKYLFILFRLLMGLRWWCLNAEDGNEHWVFESRDTEYKAHKVDYICFWGSMVIGILFWGLFGFMNVLGLRPSWVFLFSNENINLAKAVINGVCLIFLIVNIWGFLKCSTGILLLIS